MLVERVLLDTNVIIAGGLWPGSPAARLSALRDRHHFLVPESAQQEVDRLVARLSPSTLVATAAQARMRQFLEDLGAMFVAPADPSAGADAHDPADAEILAAARAQGCHYLCTYNARDFPKESIACRSPLALLREAGQGGADLFVQYPILGASGTLMVVGRIHHYSSMGRLVRDSRGLEVLCDDSGQVRARGIGVVRSRAHRPFQTGYSSAFVLRYRDGHFDVKQWIGEGRGRGRLEDEVSYERLLLASGDLTVRPPVTPLLVFGRNHGLAAEIVNISGVPRFISEDRIAVALRSLTLESISEGPDIKALLEQATVTRAPDGRGVWVGFPGPGSA